VIKQNAVSYSRVSTEDENQATSIVNQQKDSKLAIEQNGWNFVDSYVDDGKSGTTTKNRNEYNRLVQDLETDKFDIIVCKSQDRLNRNTFEWYNFTNKLLVNGKKLYFYLDRKFYNPDEDALISGITAIMDETYSRNLSKKINNAHKRRQESGDIVILTNDTYGYRKVNKQVVVDESEAKMIRLIYELSTQNVGTRSIAKQLESMGYRNRNGNRIAEQTINKIIRNPLYKGTAVMNKYHKDFNTKKTIKNPKSEWIYRDGLVPQIVDDELWQKANDAMDRRTQQYTTDEYKKIIAGAKNNLSPFSSKIVCGICGNRYWRKGKTMVRGYIYHWECSEYTTHGRKTKTNRSPKNAKKEMLHIDNTGCDNIRFQDADFNDIVYQIAQRLFGGKENENIAITMEILKKVIQNNDTIEAQQKELTNKLKSIENNRKTLLDRYLADKINDDIYQSRDNDFQKEIDNIKNEIEILESQKVESEDREKRIQRIEQEIKEIADVELSIKNTAEHITLVTAYPDKLVFSFDLFDEIVVQIKKINYRKSEYHLC